MTNSKDGQQGGQVLGGVLWITAANFGERALTFATMALLVRLLNKQDFGTATTAVAILIFLLPVTRFGTYEFLIQEKLLTEAKQTSVFVVSLIFGLIASAVLLMLSVPLAKVFHDGNVAIAIAALSPIFLLRSLSCVSEALLTRHFQFRALAIRKLISAVLASILAIVLAWRGAGYLSLIAQQLLSAALSAAALLYAYRWKLDFGGVFSDLTRIVKLGAGFTIAQLLSSFNISGYSLVIGASLGTLETGIFRLSYSAVDLVLQLCVLPLTQVAVARFAHIRSSGQDLGREFQKLLGTAAALAFLPMSWLVVAGPSTATVLYGNKYADAGPVISILSLSVSASVLSLLATSLISATGAARRLVVVSAAQALIGVCFAAVGAKFGLMGITVAFVLRSIAIVPLFAILVKQVSASGKIRWFSELSSPAVAAIGAGLACELASSMFSRLTSPLVVALFDGVFISFVYAGLLYFLRPSAFSEIVALFTAKRARFTRRQGS